jgi:hypothetical protein|tara:strand:- start:636 stop:755 length:120 start_codon:yes stop_codon:yes gene_type:complete
MLATLSLSGDITGKHQAKKTATQGVAEARDQNKEPEQQL